MGGRSFLRDILTTMFFLDHLKQRQTFLAKATGKTLSTQWCQKAFKNPNQHKTTGNDIGRSRKHKVSTYPSVRSANRFTTELKVGGLLLLSPAYTQLSFPWLVFPWQVLFARVHSIKNFLDKEPFVQKFGHASFWNKENCQGKLVEKTCSLYTSYQGTCQGKLDRVWGFIASLLAIDKRYHYQ